MFSGVVIEESLDDKSVLQGLKITDTKVSQVNKKSKTPWLKQWTLHYVEIPEVFAESAAQKLSKALESKHAWYADFKNDSVHFIIFKNKVFKIDRHSMQEYQQASDYAVSLGIPIYQANFVKTKLVS